MDNPISWAILIILLIVFTIRAARKGQKELSQYRAENLKFFEK